MENIYEGWQGYLKRLREFEMTGQPESAFPLPNGKLIGEATPEEIEEFRILWETKWARSKVAPKTRQFRSAESPLKLGSRKSFL